MKAELEVKECVMLSIEDYNRLQADLSAERTRRLAAEEVVDYLLTEEQDAKARRRLAQEYRTQYPRVEEDK